MQSLSIYEILRRFRHILRLTPFRFEDFCAALSVEDQSPLLSEIHIQLLKTLIREDRLQQTWLGPPDIRDSINVYLHSVDHTNWPAALKLYLSAEPNENSTLLATLNEHNYPFDIELTVKLETLNQLCDKFLLSNLAREVIVNGSNGSVKHDTTCRLCSKGNGDMIPCDSCTAVYHLRCSDPPLENYPNHQDEEDTYTCAICKLNSVCGVTDCIDPDEKCGNLKRLEALGEDNFGHRYWFLVRRLIVVDENENVRYYSKIDQLNELLDNLNENTCDKSLLINLTERRDEIERQMQITEALHQSQLGKLESGASMKLGQEGSHKNYINHHASNHLALSKNQQSDRDTNRSLNNKFSINSLNSFKWFGAIDGHLTVLSITIKTTILKFEAMLPSTFIHPCWTSQRLGWVKSINQSRDAKQIAAALSFLETAIKPVLFKSAWNEAIGFSQLFRSTFLEREETKKIDRLQPRGFERRESYSADIEMSFKLGTIVKFSSKLKPVKHQVWKQKGEEYRLTGINGWSWQSKSYKSRPVAAPKPSISLIKEPYHPGAKKSIFVKPKLPPCHDFLTKRDKVRSILVLPKLELKKLARSGGLKEVKSFSYTAKPSKEVWPYGMTPRPTFRTCWLYRNRLVSTMQDVSLQLKVLYACVRWDDLQARPPASGHNVIVTDESTVTIELLKKRDRLPFLTHSEYLIKKVSTPIEEPTKYRRVGTKKSTPSARSGLRARRQTIEEEIKGPTTEEVWVSEDQLELWELKQFDERIERQNQIMRERALREAAEKKRKLEEERRMKIEQERRQRLAEEAQRAAKAAASPTTPNVSFHANPALLGSQSQRPTTTTTPVIRYFRTEQGQIIRLPASYLERGTPLILRHVGPGPNQTNTYIIRPQVTPVKLEPKPEIKLEIKPESKPEIKPEIQPVLKPECKPDTNPECKLSPEPHCKPDTNSNINPESKPELEPQCEPDLEPDSRPESEPESKPETEPRVPEHQPKPEIEPEEPQKVQRQLSEPEQPQQRPEQDQIEERPTEEQPERQIEKQLEEEQEQERPIAEEQQKRPERAPDQEQEQHHPQDQKQLEAQRDEEQQREQQQQQEQSASVAQESVGTAVNETAHDQREPST